MTINDPTIAAGSTVSRRSAETAVGRITNAIPPANATVTENNEPSIIYQQPEREGQIVFHASSRNSVNAYVVVRIESIVPPAVEASSRLEWARVEPNTLIVDPRTGEEKDPLLGFYSYLAD